MEIKNCPPLVKDFFYSIKSNKLDILKSTLEKGVDVNFEILSDKSPRTGLSFAAQWGNVDAISILLDFKANIESKWKEETPLSIAVRNDHKHVVQTLLERGANPNAKDAENDFPLIIFATMRQKIEIVELLIKYGANIDAEKNGYTAFLVACQEGFLEIAKLLQSKGANVEKEIVSEDNKKLNALGLALYHGQQRILEYFKNDLKWEFDFISNDELEQFKKEEEEEEDSEDEE